MRPLHHDLGGCDVPTVLIAGSEDPKFTELAAGMAELLPNGRAVAIRDAGHAAHVEQPDAVAEVIRAHISAAEAR